MTPEALLWVAIILKLTGVSTLIGFVIYGRQVGRAIGRRRRASASDRIAEEQVAAWRSERRAHRATDLRRWDASFAALLPPPDPCTSTEHNHVENVTYGSRGRFEQICVIRPPYYSTGAMASRNQALAQGGITTKEAMDAMRRLALVQAYRTKSQ